MEIDQTRPATDAQPQEGRFSRRTLLGGALAVGAAFGATSLAARTATAAPAVGVPAAAPALQPAGVARGRTVPLSVVRRSQAVAAYPQRWTAQPFELSSVTLDDGVFKRAQEQALELARAYPVDRVLAVFRRNAGLDTRGANPPGGWEEFGPRPDVQRWGPREYSRGQNSGAGGLLRGHYGGHFLTKLSLAYASTGETALKEKVDEFVAGLEECRAALAAQTFEGAPRYSHPGFLSAYGEWQFSALEEFAPYGEIWAPYYTLHKILDGLVHAYTLTGNEQALTLAEGIGRWVHSRLSKCTPDQLERMWSIYIGGEYGGMNDVLVDLYWASPAADRELFLQTARYFDLNSLIDACAENRDILTGKHANQHVPQFSGYIKLYSATGEQRYRSATENFFTMLVPGRMYAHGGTGEGEMWGPPNTVAGDIGGRNSESCAAYNQLKVARYLFFHDQDPAYMDYYERTLLNHILGGRRNQSSTTSPQNLYMYPVHPGARKEYGNGNVGTCCGGTALESHVKYQDTIYARSADGTTLYVNLYMGSTLTWAEKGLKLSQVTDYPRAESSTLRVLEAPTGPLTMKLRIPGWVTGPVTVAVNGTPADVATEAGTYASITREWRVGDEVRVTIPLALRTEATVDRPDIQSLHHGPTVLTMLGTETAFVPLGVYGALNLRGEISRGVRWRGDNLLLAGREFEPAWSGNDVRYHMYFQRREDDAVFAGKSAAAPNPARQDGTTLLDEVWAGAPFASRTEFLERVRTVTASFMADGLLSARNRQRILLAAGQAPIDGQ
jgi:DUF1680 family protein